MAVIEVTDKTKYHMIVPDIMLTRWQVMVDTLANLASVPAALIMRVKDDAIEVFRTSNSTDNPYPLGATEHYHDKCGLYCEHAIRTNSQLLVPDALSDPDWLDNPDVPLNMISYLGVPVLFPDGVPFGTICILDSKPNEYNAQIEHIIGSYKEAIEYQLAQLYQVDEIKEVLRSITASMASTNDVSLQVITELQYKLMDLTRVLDSTIEQLTAKAPEQCINQDDTCDIKCVVQVSNLAKSQFLASIGHEIRTLLHGVMGMIQLANDTHLIDEQAAYAKAALQSSWKLLDAFTEVLDFSQVQAGQGELHEESFNLLQELQESISMFVPLANENNIEIISHVDVGENDLLFGDISKIRQILFNLIGNAIKYSDSETIDVKVSSSVGSEGGRTCLLFSVEDSGVGISDDQISCVVNPTAHGECLTLGAGCKESLGLSIVKELVEQMGGEFEIESEQGIGSTFSFCVIVDALGQ